MRTVIQRVLSAQVVVDGETVGSIESGLLLLVGVAPEDTESDVSTLVRKVAGMRIFPDADGKMNLSVSDIGGSVLVVSQFTLLADVRRGRRPSFTSSADPEFALPLVEAVCAGFTAEGLSVSSGIFGAHMEVASVNDGPVTIILDTADGQVA